MKCLKIILFLVLCVLLSSVLLQAQSDFSFSIKEMKKDTNSYLNKETLLLTTLEAHLMNLQQQLNSSEKNVEELKKSEQTSQTLITNLESNLKQVSTSLDNLKIINQNLETDYQKAQNKVKMLKITLGTVIPITFCASIGVGIAIGLIVANNINN